MTELLATTTDTELARHDVVLVTRDGAESTIRCDSQTTVLAAAEQAGLVLKSSCRTGGCGACSAVLDDGQVDMGKHDPDVIEVPESQNGILLCCSVPRGDCRIRLPYGRDQIVAAAPQQRQVQIIGLDRAADAVMRMRVALLPRTDGSASRTSNRASSCESPSPTPTPGVRTRRPTSPTGTASSNSTFD